MNDEAANTSHAYYATEPFWGRFWRKLGFHWGHVPYMEERHEDERQKFMRAIFEERGDHG